MFRILHRATFAQAPEGTNYEVGDEVIVETTYDSETYRTSMRIVGPAAPKAQTPSPEAFRGVQVHNSHTMMGSEAATRTIGRELDIARAEAIEDVVAWMRIHLSGHAAPHEDDFADMRVWLEERRRMRRTP